MTRLPKDRLEQEGLQSVIRDYDPRASSLRELAGYRGASGRRKNATFGTDGMLTPDMIHGSVSILGAILMNVLSANTISSKALAGTVIGQFSHPGGSGGQFVLDAEAQVFFSVNTKNQLVWSPTAGASVTPGFCAINVSAIFSGYDAEDSQFIIQVTA